MHHDWVTIVLDRNFVLDHICHIIPENRLDLDSTSGSCACEPLAVVQVSGLNCIPNLRPSLISREVRDLEGQARSSSNVVNHALHLRSKVKGVSCDYIRCHCTYEI